MAATKKEKVTQQPISQQPIKLSEISSSAGIERILARQPKPRTSGNQRFVETAQGRKVRLENERKLRRALFLNQLRSEFRSRGIRGTQVSKGRRRPVEAEGRLRKPSGELRVSKPSLLGG